MGDWVIGLMRIKTSMLFLAFHSAIASMEHHTSSAGLRESRVRTDVNCIWIICPQLLDALVLCTTIVGYSCFQIFILFFRNRFEDYEKSCGYDKRADGCQSNENCRRAVVSLMGTVLTTNCTCGQASSPVATAAHGDSYYGNRHRCLHAMQRIHQKNVCRGKIRYFYLATFSVYIILFILFYLFYFN